MHPTTEAVIAIGSVVAGAGAVGGFAKCFLAGGFKKPKSTKDVWEPGWLAHIVSGSLAALVIWGMYGPVTNLELYNPGAAALMPTLKVGDVMAAFTMGLAGGQILSSFAQKNASESTRKDLVALLRETRQELDKTDEQDNLDEEREEDQREKM